MRIYNIIILVTYFKQKKKKGITRHDLIVEYINCFFRINILID